MIIEFRDETLKYPRAIKKEKVRIILDWLLEFRFSSLDILSKRIGSNKVNSNRFFNQLIKDKVIQVFSNVHTNNERYVMLTPIGMSYLEEWGRDISIGTTRVSQLGKYSKIMHDIAVQYCALNRLNEFEEIVWDRNIQLKETFDRPDLLMKSHKGYWVAFEYERWRKDSKRIYISYVNHAKALMEKQYAGVYFLFDSETDQKHYKKLFDEENWPLYKRESKANKIKRLQNDFKPNDINNLRRCFIFSKEVFDKG